MTESVEKPGLINWIIIISLGMIWGSAFMSISLSLEGYPPFWTAALRVFLGAIALVLLAPLFGQSLRDVSRTKNGWRASIILGITAAAFPMTLLTWGISRVPSAFAGVAIGAIPLLVLPLAYLFLPEEGIGPRRVIGVCLGFIGLALLIGGGALEPAALLGQIACIIGACSYATSSIITRKSPKMPPLAFGAATLLCGSLILLPLAWVLEGPPQLAALSPSLALLYLGVIPTGIAAALRVRVISTAGSVFMSQTSYMIPIWGTLFGVTILGEGLPPQFYISLALILAGIAVSQSRKKKAAP